jgi:hypothetical protein
VHGVGAVGKVVYQRQLRRGQVIAFFKKLRTVSSAWRRARQVTIGPSMPMVMRHSAPDEPFSRLPGAMRAPSDRRITPIFTDSARHSRN